MMVSASEVFGFICFYFCFVRGGWEVWLNHKGKSTERFEMVMEKGRALGYDLHKLGKLHIRCNLIGLISMFILGHMIFVLAWFHYALLLEIVLLAFVLLVAFPLTWNRTILWIYKLTNR